MITPSKATITATGQHGALYKTARWQKLRASVLAASPFCTSCAERGRATLATVANHRIPHRGDLTLFGDPAALDLRPGRPRALRYPPPLIGTVGALC